MHAKKELLDFVGGRSILCARIGVTEDTWDEVFGDEGKLMKIHILRKGYSHEDFLNFLDSLDFEYDDGFGAQ